MGKDSQIHEGEILLPTMLNFNERDPIKRSLTCLHFSWTLKILASQLTFEAGKYEILTLAFDGKMTSDLIGRWPKK